MGAAVNGERYEGTESDSQKKATILERGTRGLASAGGERRKCEERKRVLLGRKGGYRSRNFFSLRKGQEGRSKHGGNHERIKEKGPTLEDQ